MYNKDYLDVESLLKRNLFHRDALAHLFRYSHILKIFKRGEKILDLGCGPAFLYETLYRNRRQPEYLGVDIRKRQIEKNIKKFPKAKFKRLDIVEDSFESLKDDWSYIVLFEVIEHIGKENAKTLMKKVYRLANKETLVLVSTPNRDTSKKIPSHHIINGEVGEFYHKELINLFNDTNFEVIEKFGTFISQADYTKNLNREERRIFNELKKYYDSTALSLFFAPMFPEKARNCLWKLKAKK